MHKIPDQHTWKAGHQGTTQNSYTIHCAHISKSVNVKAQNLYHVQWHCTYHTLQAQNSWNTVGSRHRFDVHRALNRNIISIANPTRCTNVWNLFYFGIILHVSDGLSVHHQEFKNIHTAVKQMLVAVCTVLNFWWWTERPSQTCRVSFQNEINLRHWCI